MKINIHLTWSVLLLLTYSIALAAWQDDFDSIFTEEGIDAAVIAALAEGASPEQITKKALPLAGLKKEKLFKALFCALAQPDAIQDAATANDVNESIVQEGYQLALTECSRQMDENLNTALDTSQKYQGNTSSSKQSRRTNYASPAAFK